MQQEIKTCQNCKQDFVIEPEDFDFYEKIKVPAPTFCPDCRMRRRFVWRNERTLYRNVCAKTGKKIISGFAPDSGLKVYDRETWWSDDWDPMAYGTDYDFSKSFFKQWKEFFEQVPHPSVFNTLTVNCDYTQYTGNMKDAYLVSASWGGENLAYAARVHFCRDTFDAFAVYNSELCYEDVNVFKSSRTHFSQNCESCVDGIFLYDCRGCTNCIGCTGLRNKSYHIFNQPYPKEEYQNKIRELKINTYAGIRNVREKFEALKQQQIRKYATLIKCERSTGDNMQNVADSKNCFDISGDTQNCKFIQNGADRLTDSYDGYGVGASVDLLYEAFDSGVEGSRQLFCMTVYGCHDATYSFNCHGCGNIFGCIGLRNKEYCIFNKQYSKEDYEVLVPKIKKHMEEMPYIDKNGRTHKYGEFFPTELSPFGYNETAAQDFMPVSKEVAQTMGFNWRDTKAPEHQPTFFVQNLPDAIEDSSIEITKENLGCLVCGKAYRIIAKEYQFLTQFHLPLPRLCPECRHQARLKLRNPLKLWHRQCMCDKNHPHHSGKCPNEFETSYASDRPEIVYCEQCYNAEVA
ncbi:MAG: hypothetical protein A2599_02275 [Candidatus Staskawiczbacteria bacterium RIFOXYD1_FULL_39_28]|uniref:Zinc-binding domain-containing protein n=1 Tax=Candidatus Staskawiczbacteria bacterium RIFOXYC1_FULL_38_18 TaxID=1802229 RepID=A0A1G2JE74_9BACT|nr:MAG: hypothetical protein A2401_03290 [Candidatus Staskawiczbacteria bacterium RIFOXYC1_FULL_38_18]OGZ91894.1 MAG: hypothetical protein A2599_02275 [Candidatus Staskawiczbacteria bacterium RIFOXYD1_FULL_39_28]